MLEIFSEVSISYVLQILSPIFFLFGVLLCLTILLGILSILFRPYVRAEAVAAIKAFAHNVKAVAAHFLF